MLGSKQKPRKPYGSEVFSGSGRRIRTLTYGVRVRCATITQSRCVPDEQNLLYRFLAICQHLFSEKIRKFLQAAPRPKERPVSPRSTLCRFQIFRLKVLLQRLFQQQNQHKADGNTRHHIRRVIEEGIK